jgi:hypothetical protein
MIEDVRMTGWTKDELTKIAGTDDLHVSPYRKDGKTYGTPTWIWSVVIDETLYVRACNGQQSRWYQAALTQKAGRITAASMTREVRFEPVDGTVNERIDQAYRSKYAGSAYLGPWWVRAHMNTKHLLVLGASILAASPASPGGAQEPLSPYVRVAEIEIDPGQLEPYRAAVKEQIQAAVELEPGVLALYSVADKENPFRT